MDGGAAAADGRIAVGDRLVAVKNLPGGMFPFIATKRNKTPVKVNTTSDIKISLYGTPFSGNTLLRLM